MKLADLPRHHAVLLVQNNRIEVGEKLWKELSSQSIANRFFNQTVLDIDTARNIISWANTPYNDEKTALISFHTAGLAAQNAMLKILEEPNEKVKFILLTSNKSNLIGTILSRVNYVEDKSEKNKSNINAGEFLQATYSTRMKLPFVVEMLAKIDEEGRKDREGVRGFILSLAEEMSLLKMEPQYITETFEIASYASDPSASGKALIEYLSLLLPKVK